MRELGWRRRAHASGSVRQTSAQFGTARGPLIHSKDGFDSLFSRVRGFRLYPCCYPVKYGSPRITTFTDCWKRLRGSDKKPD
ncbi:hypothetical protein J6590_032727 [Homalodisca vitripennis]|nr:hypothetical protein J6590_032727 [Homalodisca vitripennis]